MRVHISTKRDDSNTRKREEEGRAALLHGREGKVTASIAACTVGAMTSLLLLVIKYTDTHRHTE